MAIATGQAAAPAFEAIHAGILLFFPELVRSLGGDPDRLIAQAGARPARSPHGRLVLSYRQVIALLERAAAELACPDFGLRLAALQSGLEMFGPLGVVMRHSRTFGDALDYACTHSRAHSLAARIWIKRLPREDALFVGHDILLDRLTDRAQAIEQILMVGHLAAIAMTGGRVRVRRVHFRHQPAMPLAAYRRRFGCDVRFGQKGDGVFFAGDDLACPIVAPDARIYRAATAYIDSRFGGAHLPLHTQVRGFVMQHLGTRHCTNSGIAAECGLHKRILHRRLAEEATSFQKIKDEVRRDLMLYYLQRTALDFARISEKLGFSEQSVMTRCCHRWLRGSPTAIRRAAGDGEGTPPAPVQIDQASA